MESDYIFEEIKSLVALGSIWEVGNLRRPWPRDDRYQRNTDDDSTLNAREHSTTAILRPKTLFQRTNLPIHHQECRHDTTTEYSNPQRRIPHFMTLADAGDLVLELSLAPRQVQWCGDGTRDGAYTSRVCQPDKRQE